MQVSQFLRYLRTKSGLSIAQASGLTLIDPATIWSWEHGHSSPSNRSLEKLTRFYDISPHELKTLCQLLVEFRSLRIFENIQAKLESSHEKAQASQLNLFDQGLECT